MASCALAYCCYRYFWGFTNVITQDPCRYVITLRYTLLQGYWGVGYSPLYILLTLGTMYVMYVMYVRVYVYVCA